MTETSFTPEQERQARKAAFGSFAGAVIDWYDFILYGLIAALVFNTAFFPDVSPAIGTLAAFATFGVGFFFRPLGGIVFGHFGDRLGRKRMLVITMLVMGLASTGIGLLPTFDSIGWWAPALLVLLRAIQGFAVGGEWGGAALMAVESAPPKKKAFYSSGVQVGYSVGLLIATGSVAILSATLSDEDFNQWGWRIPFIASIVLVAIGLWIRSSVNETAEFTEKVVNSDVKKQRKIPLFEALKAHPTAFLKIIGLRFAELFIGYIVTAFALSYATNHTEISRGFMLDIILVVGALGIVTIPTFAYLSDRFGRKRIYVFGSVVGAVCAAPFFMAMDNDSLIGTAILAVILFNIGHDSVVSAQQPLFTEMFGAEYRYSGAGVGYQVASAIAGGLTPFIAALLVGINDGGWYLVAAYLGIGCAVSAVIAASISHGDSDRSTAALDELESELPGTDANGLHDDAIESRSV